MEQIREPLSRRLRRFAVLIAVIFTLTTAVVVTQRLSTDALALLIGLTLGVIAMVPTLGLGLMLWKREQSRSVVQQNASPARPPVIVVTPQSLPYGSAYGGQSALDKPQSANWQWQMASSERRFTVVGGEE